MRGSTRATSAGFSTSARTPSARWRATEASSVARMEGATAEREPARMELLRDAAVAAVREERCQIEAGARVLRDLQQYALAQEEMDVGDDGGPVEALGRHVLAEGAGRDRVALGSEVVDRLEGKQAH